MKFLLQEKVDILVLTETKLSDSFTSNHFLIEGYSKPFRLDRNRNGRGLLVYIKEDIPVNNLNLIVSLKILKVFLLKLI